MPARSSDLTWLELTDFSPGVFSNNNLAGGVHVTAPNVAMAQPANTYRCRALPTGGLGPLPRMKKAFSLTTVPAGGTGRTYTINGLGTWGFVLVPSSATPTTDPAHRIEVHLLLTYNVPNAANWDQTAKWVRENIFQIPASTEVLATDTEVAQAAQVTYQFAYFLKTRMNPADVLQPGQPVMACIWSNPEQTLFVNKAHPNPATPTTNALIDVGSASGLYRRAVAHQGRVVLGRYIPYARGVDTNLSTDENFIWTEVNSNVLVSSTPAVFVPEIDQTITDMGAMSANQLIVIKSHGGGYVLQGDLDDVTVVQLPNLASPDGTPVVRGTNTPIGFVYSAGNNGLYVWNGGDASEPISQQLDGSVFTGGATLARQGFLGQMTRWLDLIAAPYFWTYDMETKGWWRLDDPANYPGNVIFFESTTYGGQMIAARESFTDASPNAFYLFDHDDLAYTYSWQSHPIWISRDHYIETRQGVIALQGHGKVTVTLLDEDGNTSSHGLEIHSDTIRNIRFNTSMSAEALQIRIESSGRLTTANQLGTSEAPKVHRLYLGYREGTHLALTDAGV